MSITNLDVLTGSLTRQKQRLLLQWAAVHQGELMRNWELARRGEPHGPIGPTVTKEN